MWHDGTLWVSFLTLRWRHNGRDCVSITSLTIVYSTVYSHADPRKHQNSTSRALVRGIQRGPVNSPHKWPVTRKMSPFEDVIMNWLCVCWSRPSHRRTVMVIFDLSAALQSTGRPNRRLYAELDINNQGLYSLRRHRFIGIGIPVVNPSPSSPIFRQKDVLWHILTFLSIWNLTSIPASQLLNVLFNVNTTWTFEHLIA